MTDDDPLAVPTGCLHALILTLPLWAIIAAAAWWLWQWAT